MTITHDALGHGTYPLPPIPDIGPPRPLGYQTWDLPPSPPDTRHGTYSSPKIPDMGSTPPRIPDMGPTPSPWIPDMDLPPQLLTSGGHHWRPVQTCSLEDSPPQLVLTFGGGNRSGRYYASYWNASLLTKFALLCSLHQLL